MIVPSEEAEAELHSPLPQGKAKDAANPCRSRAHSDSGVLQLQPRLSGSTRHPDSHPTSLTPHLLGNLPLQPWF